jgi:hypothetical protein
MWEILQRAYFKMKKKLVFRSWSYFRVGYAQYFAFILAMLNMLTTTYYLAIKDDPTINTIFPNFSIYVIISSVIGVPLLVIVGYLHMKKSPAFSADQDILWESFPYSYKLPPGIQKECIAPLYLELLRLGRKSLSNEKLTSEELKQLQIFENKLELIAKGGSISIPKKFDEIK